MVDFTESVLVALYFALNGCDDGQHDFAVWCVDGKSLCNVEIQKAINKAVSRDYGIDAMRKLNGRGYRDVNRGRPIRCTGVYYNAISAISANEEFAENILGDEIDNPQLNEVGLDIIWLYPKHRNARMGAQAGLFLMPTHLDKSFMEALKASCNSLASDSLNIENTLTVDNVKSLRLDPIVKFEFNADLRDEGRILLKMANITPRNVYPDIEGIVKELRGEF